MKKSAFILETGALRDKPKTIQWKADKQECDDLAKRLDVMEVKQFISTIHAQRGHLIDVKGHIQAVVIQACVVSGEPVEQKIQDDFEEFFTDDKRYQFSIDIDMETPDVTLVENNRIDLAELVTQYLILSLDPYPHKAGVHFEQKFETNPSENPFAVLKKLKH